MWLARAIVFVWVALNGGLLMHDHQDRLLKMVLCVTCGIVAAAVLLDFLL
jgi:ribonuclease PH